MTDKKQNGDARTDSSTVEDTIDFTYKEKPWKLPTVLRWRNIIAFILLHLGALYGLILISSTSPSTLAWTAFCYIFSGLGVTAGAHRLWSHRSYKVSFPLSYLCQLHGISGKEDLSALHVLPVYSLAAGTLLK